MSTHPPQQHLGGCSVAAVASSSSAAAALDEVRAPGDVATSSSTLRPKEKRTLWVGDLDRAEGVVDEAYVKSHMLLEFSACITAVRICRDRLTRQPSFGFVEFSNQRQAQYVLEHMNGKLVPGRMHKYRLNWAHFNLTETQENRTSYSRPAQLNRNQETASDSNPRRPALLGGGRGKGGTGPSPESVSIWVGSLDPGTCREEVEELFEAHYSSVCLVKLIMDPNSGTCKGFGFVHFTDPEEAERALEEMNGAVCRGRRIRVNRSNNSKASSSSSDRGAEPSLQNAWRKICGATAAEAERLAVDCCGGFVPTKRKRGVLTGGTARVVVRGLDAACCSEEELRRHFSPFGELLQVRIAAAGKAYLTYAEPLAAAHAVACMHGASVGTAQVAVEDADALQQQQGYSAAAACRRPSSLQADQAATALQQQMYAAAQYAHSLPSAYAAAACYGNLLLQQPRPSSSKRQRLDDATEEADLNGGLFADTDPSLVPPELLPCPMFSQDSLFNRGSQERHVFFQEPNPCLIQTPSTSTPSEMGLGRFCLERVDEEVQTCFQQLEAISLNKLHRKCCGEEGPHLSPDDQERLYSPSEVECASFVSCF
ncbi:hypothetical protein Esti_001160 [Eimeria stiedai]